MGIAEGRSGRGGRCWGIYSASADQRERETDCPLEATSMPMKDNDIDTKVCMQFKVQGRNPRGGGRIKGASHARVATNKAGKE